MSVDIGSKIMKKRQELRLTQCALAKQAGIAQSTLSYIEHGKKRPQFNTMSAICRVLGISVLELLTFEERRADRKLFEETLAARSAAGGMPEEQRLRIIEFEKYLYNMYMVQSTGTDEP